MKNLVATPHFEIISKGHSHSSSKHHTPLLNYFLHLRNHISSLLLTAMSTSSFGFNEFSVRDFWPSPPQENPITESERHLMDLDGQVQRLQEKVDSLGDEFEGLLNQRVEVMEVEMVDKCERMVSAKLLKQSVWVRIFAAWIIGVGVGVGLTAGGFW